jgi:hypothetical protein
VFFSFRFSYRYDGPQFKTSRVSGVRGGGGGGGLEGERKWVGVGGGREMENLQTHVLIAVIRE